jgi:uncharacterized protein involved in exopolysaccharide biosynthesis
MIDKRGESFRLRRYLAPLTRHKWLIVTFCAASALSSLGLTYVLSEKYQASITVFYQPRENVSFQDKSKDALGYPLPLVPLETIANTLEDIVRGDAVLEKTVRMLRLDIQVKKPAANWFIGVIRDLKDDVKEWRENAWQILKYGRLLPKDPVRGAMVRLQADISVKRINKAYTFRLMVLDSDPTRAAEIANTLGALLSDFVVQEQAQTTRETRANIERRLLQASADMQQLRTELEGLKRKTGISSLDEELTLRLKTINGFEEELAKSRNELRSLEDRRAELAAQLGRQDSTVKYDSTVADNPVFNQLRMEQARLEVERSGLLQEFTPQHAKVKAVEAELAKVLQRLSQEAPKLVSSESTRPSEIHQKLQADLLGVEAQIEALRAKGQEWSTTIARETATARRLIENEPGVGQLKLRVAAAERSYQLINEAYEEARLAESQTLSQVMLPSPALVPSEPARPIKIIHILVTFLLSLALAIGSVFLGNYFDSRVYDIVDAEQSLGMPVLATIPAAADPAGVLLGKSNPA